MDESVRTEILEPETPEGRELLEGLRSEAARLLTEMTGVVMDGGVNRLMVHVVRADGKSYVLAAANGHPHETREIGMRVRALIAAQDIAAVIASMEAWTLKQTVPAGQDPRQAMREPPACPAGSWEHVPGREEDLVVKLSLNVRGQHQEHLYRRRIERTPTGPTFWDREPCINAPGPQREPFVRLSWRGLRAIR